MCASRNGDLLAVGGFIVITVETQTGIIGTHNYTPLSPSSAPSTARSGAWISRTILANM